jgi:hypothetical protein
LLDVKSSGKQSDLLSHSLLFLSSAARRRGHDNWARNDTLRGSAVGGQELAEALRLDRLCEQLPQALPCHARFVETSLVFRVTSCQAVVQHVIIHLETRFGRLIMEPLIVALCFALRVLGGGDFASQIHAFLRGTQQPTVHRNVCESHIEGFYDFGVELVFSGRNQGETATNGANTHAAL